MSGRKTSGIFITALLTTFFVGGVVYLLMDSQVNRLEEEVSILESTNASLQEQLENMQEALPPGNENDSVISREPNPGWQDYFPTHDSTTLEGESVEQVRELLGEPPALLRSIAEDPAFNREIWIYMPFEEDSTGLYLFFKSNQLTGSRLDEFTGLPYSGLLDDESFWY